VPETVRPAWTLRAGQKDGGEKEPPAARVRSYSASMYSWRIAAEFSGVSAVIVVQVAM
jgi:hypothetical protein